MMYGVGASSGAALGGVMADYLGWRWEFGVQLAPLLLCICLATLAVPQHLGRQYADEDVWQALRTFDFCGLALLTISITSLVLGLVSTP
jgi:predicted MFS family arabinose efflux permease